MKRLTLFFIFFFFFTNLFYCQAQREDKIKETQNQCLQTMYVASLNAGRTGFSGSFQFLGSCSGSSNYSPSCIESYAVTREELTCLPGYTKSSAKCSTQNLVGVCRYQPNGDTTKVNTIVYVKPNDTKEFAMTDCQNIGAGSIFTETYFNPTDRTTSLDTILTNGFLCVDRAQKN
ncbi:hypothetical protein LEP1GSC202_1276 [Leptospira yanagawae serovar Saopaulo str. Sao Paulo = ATCC 700523]|uniref:Uncharacterized protein n=1 Tax=Leptospira yanagawae serovar Saopaulo str. Sao Paulo = ATCC 700523 TaxID=1249483 RepID=A0A5E8HE42_9LEPT|nr:hypothetical protein [Leptospira yanagawae]EOQ89057.1 hypothetical protein LEP1GSC202_1276 [Leptospira yanagawae serovar Saopaulo str. Sao Paulo = ATCC 700523]